jgi:hypothetical protein
MTLRKITLRTLAHPIAVRATQRFADTDLGISGPARRHTDRSPPKEQVRQPCLALPVSRLPLQAPWRPFQLVGRTIGRASGRALSIWAHVLLRPWTFCPDSVAAANQDRRIKRQDARAAIPSKAALRLAATSSSHSSATRQAPSADARAALPRWVRCPSRAGPGSRDSRR